jgi:hypothetical protein
VVSRHDPFITTDDRALCSRLASEIGSLAKELVEVFGADRPEDADQGEFLREYEDSRVLVQWRGPKALPSEFQYKVLVFRKRPFARKGSGGWPPVIWMFNSAPAALECDSEIAKEILKHLKRVAALPCHCCGAERPKHYVPLDTPLSPGWIRLETNLTNVDAPEKVACSRECVDRWARRFDK